MYGNVNVRVLIDIVGSWQWSQVNGFKEKFHNYIIIVCVYILISRIFVW